MDGNTNLAIFNSLIHLGANPALFGLISRPDFVPRDTLQNILDTKQYTLNYVTSAQYEKAHQTSARYDRGISEFKKVGFKEQYQPSCSAPFVEDAVVKIDAALIETDGYVALSDADVLISQGLDAYFISKSIGRLPYAKPFI